MASVICIFKIRIRDVRACDVSLLSLCCRAAVNPRTSSLCLPAFSGDKLCAMLDKKLEQHRRAGHDIPLPNAAAVPCPHRDGGGPPQHLSCSPGGAAGMSNGAATKTAKASRPKPQRGPRQYVPLPRSGAHAILLTLARQRKEVLVSRL